MPTSAGILEGATLSASNSLPAFFATAPAPTRPAMLAPPVGTAAATAAIDANISGLKITSVP